MTFNVVASDREVSFYRKCQWLCFSGMVKHFSNNNKYKVLRSEMNIVRIFPATFSGTSQKSYERKSNFQSLMGKN